jgi:2,3-diketo-5-methylthiopentyl-1-phosphate enolase
MAAEAGAGALMINFIATGLSSLEAIRDLDINIPVLAHYASVGSITESPYTGISSQLMLGKLSRIAGADMCMFSSPYSSYPIIKRRYMQIADSQRSPLYNIKKTMPVVGGSITPFTAEKIIKDLGKDVVLAVGGSIIGHPLGAIAGAKAIMEAIDYIRKDIALDETIKKKCSKALRVSLEKWQ